MRKIVLSLIALGAISGTAFAEAGDLDREGLAEAFATGSSYEGGVSAAQPLQVSDESGLTAFQKAKLAAKGEFSDR